MTYNHKAVEKKWQTYWDEHKTYACAQNDEREKFFALIEFPYPSGVGLHVGHPRPYTALDIVARKRRMQNYNVLFPIGWDAFGLPAENYAMKNKVHPKTVTQENIAHFKSQLKALGFSFDWDREVNTTDPDYYKWTQWIFLQMFKHGLAYKQEMPVNWCTSCKVGLANEEVVQGQCERCGGDVVHKVRNQWMLAITKYAQRLIDDLDTVNFLPRIKVQQMNWIGRSEGMDIDFAIAGTEDVLRVYTTRPDTLFGATYMVISPEHPYLAKYVDRITNLDEVHAYQEEVKRKSDFERTEMVKEKTGVLLEGLRAVNPATEEEIPVWISDYVLMTYGTGAIMAVPGHDQRDWEFATKFDMPIVEVIQGGDISKEAYIDVEEGVLINSDYLNGMQVKDAIEEISGRLEARGIGTRKVNFKLRDWVFSRQRYWGEPIPLVHCDDCGWVAIPEEELPLVLPPLEDYEPTETGESPLAKMTDWVNTTCPSCGKPARRETDTMPQWAGSSWYFLRYTDPHNSEALASKEALEHFMPVDWYNGGMEHTTLHLLYSRFWHKFLYDIGVVHTPEPYQKRTSHGMILGEDNEKMSKSRGNVINPDEIVEEFGGDTLRTYEMFIGDFEKTVPWSENGVKGCRRFLERVWRMQEKVVPGDDYGDLHKHVHKVIKKVSHDFETLKFNTGIAALMELTNTIYDAGQVTKPAFETFLLLLYPVAPHITEELWQIIGAEGYVHDQSWPEYDEAATVDDTITLPVQVNGKMRGTIEVAPDAAQEVLLPAAREVNNIQKHIEGKKIVKEIYVPGKIYNLIVK